MSTVDLTLPRELSRMGVYVCDDTASALNAVIAQLPVSAIVKLNATRQAVWIQVVVEEVFDYPRKSPRIREKKSTTLSFSLPALSEIRNEL